MIIAKKLELVFEDKLKKAELLLDEVMRMLNKLVATLNPIH